MSKFSVSAAMAAFRNKQPDLPPLPIQPAAPASPAALPPVPAASATTGQLDSLAKAAAEAQDSADEAAAKAKTLKEELEAAMTAAKVTEIQMPDRQPISFHTSNPSKRPTLKALTDILGAPEAKTLWGKIPTGKPATSLKIPRRGVEEPAEAE
jgi:hypothetical protein